MIPTAELEIKSSNDFFSKSGLPVIKLQIKKQPRNGIAL